MGCWRDPVWNKVIIGTAYRSANCYSNTSDGFMDAVYPTTRPRTFLSRQLLNMSDKVAQMLARQITASKEPLLELGFYFSPL